MSFVFEKDDKGLLHQVDMTLEDISKAGRHMGMMAIQTCYVLFTEAQEKELAAQKADAAAKEEARLIAVEKQRSERQAAQQDAAKAAFALEKAKKDAEAQKDNALVLALEQLSLLKDKVAAMEASSQSPNS